MGNALHRHCFVRSLFALFILALCTPGLQAKEDEVARIKRLLRVVAVSQMSFILDGTVYSAEEMSRHLQDKMKKTDKKNRTVEYFLSHLANSSSRSGKPYKVVLENGQTMYAGPWFRGLLHDIEKGRFQEPTEGNVSALSSSP